jgi:uracil phosphoribosyltransferase
LSRLLHKNKQPLHNIRIYANKDTEHIRQKLHAQQKQVASTLHHLDTLSTILLQEVKKYCDNNHPGKEIVPIIVARSGLTMDAAARKLFPNSPFGLIVPFRPVRTEKPKIRYGNIPQFRLNRIYLFLDPLIHSGETFIACLDSFSQQFEDKIQLSRSLMLANLFTTSEGCGRISEQFSNILIHTLWHDWGVDPDGNMAGINFDVGDYALLGASGDRHFW